MNKIDAEESDKDSKQVDQPERHLRPDHENTIGPANAAELRELINNYRVHEEPKCTKACQLGPL